MTQGSDGFGTVKDPTGRPGPTQAKLLFADDTGFQAQLQRRVAEFFGLCRHDQYADWRMVLKTFTLLGAFAGAYVLLVFVARELWQGLALAGLLGLATATIGLTVQHDGGHRAYSRRPWVNKLAAAGLDLIGGSSYVWLWKHAYIHHRYVNIAGWDTDIDFGILARASPHARRRWFHRWQHVYIWPFYGLLAVKWQLVDDFHNVLTGRVGPHRMPRPTGRDLVLFIAGKAVFFSWAFAIPLLRHPIGVVAMYYGVAAAVLGMVLSVVFQLPHCTGRSDFPLPSPETGRMPQSWSVHQAQVTADYARGSAIATWLLGGLNYHVEHHLLPGVCHIHYPQLSSLVEQTCREFGVRYIEHKTFFAGLTAHYRWLREMGRGQNERQRSPDEGSVAF